MKNKLQNIASRIHISRETKIAVGVTVGLLIAGVTVDTILRNKGIIEADITGDVPDITSFD
jgi:hypothetical protein